jgi:hypothetical protein
MGILHRQDAAGQRICTHHYLGRLEKDSGQKRASEIREPTESLEKEESEANYSA